MGKKATDEFCRSNYQKMRELFNNVVPDHDRFTIVYACGMDTGFTFDFNPFARTITNSYSSFILGFDKTANEIVIVPIDVEIEAYGKPIYLKNKDIKKAKQSWLSKEITIHDERLPKKYIQFNVQEYINEDPDNVVVLVKQDAEAKDFAAFFKNQYAK